MGHIETKLGEEAEIPLPLNSTELIHGRCCEHYTAHYLERAVTVSSDLTAKVNEFAHRVHCVGSHRECWVCTTIAHILNLGFGP